MPYETTDDLPDTVRDNLPEHSLNDYKEAFNSAWDQYVDTDDAGGEAAREETAHRIAWAAVKNARKQDAEARWESNG